MESNHKDHHDGPLSYNKFHTSLIALIHSFILSHDSGLVTSYTSTIPYNRKKNTLNNLMESTKAKKNSSKVTKIRLQNLHLF